jgi:hypothetical protein
MFYAYNTVYFTIRLFGKSCNLVMFYGYNTAYLGNCDWDLVAQSVPKIWQRNICGFRIRGEKVPLIHLSFRFYSSSHSSSDCSSSSSSSNDCSSSSNSGSSSNSSNSSRRSSSDLFSEMLVAEVEVLIFHLRVELAPRFLKLIYAVMCSVLCYI